MYSNSVQYRRKRKKEKWKKKFPLYGKSDVQDSSAVPCVGVIQPINWSVYTKRLLEHLIQMRKNAWGTKMMCIWYKLYTVYMRQIEAAIL